MQTTRACHKSKRNQQAILPFAVRTLQKSTLLASLVATQRPSATICSLICTLYTREFVRLDWRATIKTPISAKASVNLHAIFPPKGQVGGSNPSRDAIPTSGMTNWKKQ